MTGDPTKPPETPSSGEEGVTVQGAVAKMPNAVFAREGNWVGKQNWQPPETSPEQRLESRGFLEGMLVTWPRAWSLSSPSSKEWPMMSHQSHEVLCIKQHSVIRSTWEMLLPLPLPEIPSVHRVKGSQGSCREEAWCCAWCVPIRPGRAPLCVFGSVCRRIYEELLWNLMECKSHETHLLIWGTTVSYRQGHLTPQWTLRSSLLQEIREMVAPVLKSFQAEVRPKACGMSRKYPPAVSPIPPGVVRGFQQQRNFPAPIVDCPCPPDQP